MAFMPLGPTGLAFGMLGRTFEPEALGIGLWAFGIDLWALGIGRCAFGIGLAPCAAG